MTKSSIEWFIEEIENEMKFGKDLTTKDRIFYEEIIEEAKARHKEEIMEAHYAPKYGCFSEQYYNETFNTEKK